MSYHTLLRYHLFNFGMDLLPMTQAFDPEPIVGQHYTYSEVVATKCASLFHYIS